MPGPVCSIPVCGARVKAKGLCSRHYTRVARHGNAGKMEAPGPKPGARLPPDAASHAQFPFWSPRTQALFARACRRCADLARAKGEDAAALRQRLLERFTRANGTVNVSGFAREVERERDRGTSKRSDKGQENPTAMALTLESTRDRESQNTG